jgi:hypothetical protein
VERWVLVEWSGLAIERPQMQMKVLLQQEACHHAGLLKMLQVLPRGS